MIRKPTSEEAATCSRLLYLSGPHLFDFFFASRDPDVYKFITYLFNQSDILFCKENMYVDSTGGQICGLLCAAPAREIPVLDKNFSSYGLHLSKMAGIRNSLRMLLRSKLAKYLSVTDDDEFYISNLAVFIQYRGKGVGHKLLKKAQEVAREAGLRKISLLVEAKNANAKRLYEMFGFREEIMVMIPPKYHKYQIHSFYKMVKPI